MKKVLALVFLPLLAAIIVSSASASSRLSLAIPAVTLTTQTSGTSYDKKAITAPAGKEFLLIFHNLSPKQHNVSLEVGELEYGATQTIGKGTTAAIFTLKKGVYHYYSSIGNDENVGFSGTLTVK